jgi:hypothetical protein
MDGGVQTETGRDYDAQLYYVKGFTTQFMRTIFRLRPFSALVAAGLLISAVHVLAQQGTSPTAAALAEFTKRVNAYMDIHKKGEGALPDVKKGATPAEVLAFEQALAGNIKAARATAKQGDIFTPEVTPIFKKIFADYYKRRSGREIRLLFDEVPNFKPQVNMTYPAGLPKATFPPRLSLEMPQLPEELEYRLVGDSLIIRDSEANLIIDYIPGIVPATPKR